MGKARVLIVDDHPVTRLGLSNLIDAEPDLEVCGTAADVTEAVHQVAVLCPDLVIVDLALRGSSGIELIEQVHDRHGAVKMLVASMHDETLFAERVLRAGAMGYISKQEPPEEFLSAVRQVLAGEVYLSPRTASRLLHCVVAGKPGLHSPIEGLSNRELEVFQLIGEGCTTKQIARRLHLSPKTIETHREKIKKKLNLKNSAELSCRAVQWVLEQH